MTQSEIPPVDESAEGKKSRFGWLSKVPSHLPGGIRTTTAALGVLFFLVLLLWNSVRYDPTLNENSPVYVPPAPSTTEVAPTQQYTPTRVPSTTSTPTTSATAPNTTSPDVGTTGGSGTATTTPAPTTTPGFQLPTIPGLQLPGQAPTTTPAR
ncbi:hypothetical protein GCM10007304_27580 [Rhodococcoides trifolii]|uniref:Uncharacterized protein n=1 Tax=Rhodococcoides trifolii TaxID=908250 RepID=A0A917D625_9NOCA|nr:hypothetical protein [Rhodococcus trifolii]GGG12085.1 hypothetical protein GCM10007304_27580 [Rhodococcus trifolii]